MTTKQNQTKDTDTATQTRCIYCHTEQYILDVPDISEGEAGCSWCGKKPPKLTVKEYKEKYNNGEGETKPNV